MGYDWKGWSVLFYLFSALFGAFIAITPADYGLSIVAYKWIMLAIGVGMGFTAKMGASWAGKSTGDMVVDPKSIAGKVLIPFIVFLAVSACTPPPSIETEPGKKAWYAEQVLQRIDEVQNITIQLSKTTPPTLKMETATVIVQFCVSSAKVVKEMPDGWPKVVLAAFNEIKTKLPAEVAQNPTLVTALAVLEGLLVSFAGGGA
jgi:hypothetical protein